MLTESDLLVRDFYLWAGEIDRPSRHAAISLMLRWKNWQDGRLSDDVASVFDQVIAALARGGSCASCPLLR